MTQLKNTMAVAFAAVTVAALQPSLAFAHAHLKKAVPAVDSQVESPPSSVQLEFTEPLEAALCRIEVKKEGSDQVVSEGKPTGQNSDVRSIQVKLKPLPKEKATYVVSWKAVSKDTHRMSGKFKFSYAPKTE